MAAFKAPSEFSSGSSGTSKRKVTFPAISGKSNVLFSNGMTFRWSDDPMSHRWWEYLSQFPRTLKHYRVTTHMAIWFPEWTESISDLNEGCCGIHAHKSKRYNRSASGKHGKHEWKIQQWQGPNKLISLWHYDQIKNQTHLSRFTIDVGMLARIQKPIRIIHVQYYLQYTHGKINTWTNH